MTNEEKYKTPEKRLAAFMEYCDRHREKFNGCTIGNCPLRTTPTRACQFFWLDLEAEEEKPLPCPFCGGEARVSRPLTTEDVYVQCKTCHSRTAGSYTEADAIAAWNRRNEMMIADSFTWPDVVAIAAVFGSCVASILIFAKDKGGGK